MNISVILGGTPSADVDVIVRCVAGTAAGLCIVVPWSSFLTLIS